MSDVQDSNYALRVLMISQGNAPCCSALALDIDTWGIGDSRDAACADLALNVRTLISFAMQKNNVGLIERAVPEEYLNRYYARRYSRLSSDLTNDRATSIAYPNIDVDPFQRTTSHRLATTIATIDDSLSVYVHMDNANELVLYGSDRQDRPVAYPLRLAAGSLSIAPAHVECLTRRFSLHGDALRPLCNNIRQAA